MNQSILSPHETLHSFVFSEKFVNLLMLDGKKMKAYSLFFGMVDHLQKKIFKHTSKTTHTFDVSASEIFHQAILNCMPSVEVRKVRVAGTTYLVPAILAKKKQQALAMRWILEAARKKKKTSQLRFAECLADEVFDAYLKQGYARTKRNELHRLAEANRAYSRYRWW